MPNDLRADETNDARMARLRAAEPTWSKWFDTLFIEALLHDPDGPCGWQRREYWRAWRRIKTKRRKGAESCGSSC